MTHNPHDLTPKRRRRWRLALWAVVATGAAGAGGYHAWQFRSRALQSEAAAADCSAKANVTLAKMEGNFKATKQELDDLRKWKSETAKRMQTFRDMSKKLQKMVDAGRLGIRVRDGRLVVRLPEDVLFPSGSAELSRGGELALMEVAIVLRQFPTGASWLRGIPIQRRSNRTSTRTTGS
jgi:flagellar motor protein MotB